MRRLGNGINWKGQVFPRMRNFTDNNRMTGVGNALKRLYQRYLVEYEQARPRMRGVRLRRSAHTACGRRIVPGRASTAGSHTWRTRARRAGRPCWLPEGRGAKRGPMRAPVAAAWHRLPYPTLSCRAYLTLMGRAHMLWGMTATRARARRTRRT